MRAAVILCLAVACMAMPQNTKRYVDGEFMLRLDEQFIRNLQQENAVVGHLNSNFGMELVKSLRVGKLKFLLLTGRDKHMSAISALRGVKYIERNTIGYVDQCANQPSPGTYGLDRIDQREALAYSDPTSNEATYTYGDNQGEDVTVYVVDTGIDPEHENFDGRVRWGYNDPNMPSEPLRK